MFSAKSKVLKAGEMQKMSKFLWEVGDPICDHLPRFPSFKMRKVFSGGGAWLAVPYIRQHGLPRIALEFFLASDCY